MNFSTRYPGKEILDEEGIPFEDIAQNMKELNTINTYLGGHAITIEGFKRLAGGRKSISVCEIGCGGGDNLAAIHAYADKKNITLQLTGIDLKEACIQYAKERQVLPKSTTYITNDYRSVVFGQKPDIIFSSLFCHHFTHHELVEQIAWMKENSSVGFFVNDLQRHPLAFYSIQFITGMFSSSYLVKNDAPISVRRGFIKNELEEICQSANVFPVQINWRWAFRYLLLYKHG